MVVIDISIVVGMCVFDEIPFIECIHIKKISRGIYVGGGAVKCGVAIECDKIVMCGWRRDMGKRRDNIDAFGR